MGKLLERMVHHRLKHFIENRRLIPRHQIGFRKARSSTDCVTMLVTDIIGGFTRGKGTAAVALDVKGTVNALSPAAVLDQLARIRAPSIIINFVAFMITSRNLFFRERSTCPSKCGVGVPQGGVLSPLLFNLALREISNILPEGVRILQFADDILLYTKFVDVNEAQASLEEAIRRLIPWLAALGLVVAAEKSEFYVFSRTRVIPLIEGLQVGEGWIPLLSSLVYLGVVLNSDLI